MQRAVDGVTRSLYALTGAVYLALGAGVLLLGTGILPRSVHEKVFEIGQNNPSPMHLIQETGTLWRLLRRPQPQAPIELTAAGV